MRVDSTIDERGRRRAATEALEAQAPVPANNSSTRAPSVKPARLLKMARRTLSGVGRNRQSLGNLECCASQTASNDPHPWQDCCVWAQAAGNPLGQFGPK
ncbi:MAG: hypothetical protein CM1200mP34_2320 [Verrucomicrobiales bacterium]|nr:MAG: hypothetical protein CM1200mP34_2320 [Verrucomicrobiales bacterium]